MVFDTLTPARQARMREVVSNRTRFHTFVLDEVHKSHNTSAVLRTLDGFGFQDVHLIHKRTLFVRSRIVTKGADRWLTLNRHESVEACADAVVQKGYRLVVTHGEGDPVQSIDWSKPSAIVVGAELDGVDEKLVARADQLVKVPMCGFVESFNVSVAVACIAFELRQSLSRLPSSDWMLSDLEREQLLVHWAKLTRHLV